MDTWGTSQHIVFERGDELIENYLVLGADGIERRYFRVKETFNGKTNVTSTTCASGSYTLADGVITSDLLVKQGSSVTNAPLPSSTRSRESANAALVGPQLRVERIDLGSPAPVIVYDRMTLPDDIDATCPQ